MSQATPAKDVVRPFFDAIKGLACRLADRWRDESEYEDIEEYRKVLQEACTPFNVQVTHMLRRPFGFVFTTPALPQPWAMKILARRIRCEPSPTRSKRSRERLHGRSHT